MSFCTVRLEIFGDSEAPQKLRYAMLLVSNVMIFSRIVRFSVDGFGDRSKANNRIFGGHFEIQDGCLN